MIDSQQIEDLLKETKLSSMTDIIHFILKQVVKVISFQPMQDLSNRIEQLQRQQGLDNVMLEQVKTLIEAMLEQKQDQIKKDLQRSIQCNVSMAIQQENSRRSLRQIDIFQIVSKQNSEKNVQSSQPKSMVNNHQSQLDSLKRQITEMRVILQRKPDRRQINDFKIQTQKQLSNKMTLYQAEKIIQKFQRDVFSKLSETTTSLQRIQFQVKKILMNEVVIMKKQLSESFKMNDVKQKSNKLQKKVKKIDNQVNFCLKNFQCSLDVTKKDCKDSIEQICTLIQNLDSKIKVSQQQISDLTNKMNKKFTNNMLSGVWISQNKSNLRNLSISWEKQFFNQNCQLYKFEVGKSTILVTEPGFYIVQVNITGCQKQPELLINLLSYGKVSRSTSNKFLSYNLKQIIKFSEGITKLSLRLDNQNNYVTALLKITKVG